MQRISQAVSGVVALALAMAVSGAYGAQDTADVLPPVETVLKRAVAQSTKEDEIEKAFKQHYTYTRTKVTEHRNSEGQVTKREEKKRLNKPKAVTTKPAETTKPKTRTTSEFTEKDRAFEKSDFVLTDDILNRFTFVIQGRETVGGRSTLVLDFSPKSKDLPERNIKDRFINRAAGRVWLDEEDFALAKADLRLTERVNVIGGLVGAVWKFNYKLQRERTPDGLWFSRAVDWHLEGREVFARRIINYHEERTDVKKAWEFQAASR